jgi:hypothetical protein
MSKILLIGLILCGCGGGVTRPGGPSGTLKQEQVSALVSDEVKALLEVSGPQNLDATKSSALEVALSTAATTIESGLASDLRSQDSADLCQVQLIGTNTDADNDGIEVSLTKSFSCDVNQNGSSLSVSGKSAIKMTRATTGATKLSLQTSNTKQSRATARPLFKLKAL